MSCPPPSAPINLSKDEANQCILQCSFSFDYKPAPIAGIANDDESIIQAVLEKSSAGSAKFGTVTYDPVSMYICHPGLHTFGGTRAKGEVLIVHEGQTPNTNKTLIVSIPLDISNFDYNEDLNTVVTTAGIHVPRGGETSCGSTCGDIDLQRVVPIAPFYTYTGTNILQGCDKATYVVFDLSSSVALSANVFQTLTRICKTNPIKVVSNPGHYQYNPNGPALSSGDETYMECAPTGSSKEKVLVDNPTSKGPGTNLKMGSFSSMGQWVNKFMVDDVEPVIKVAVGIILFFVLLKLYDMVSSKITGSGGGGNSVGSLLGVNFGKSSTS